MIIVIISPAYTLHMKGTSQLGRVEITEKYTKETKEQVKESLDSCIQTYVSVADFHFH